MNYATLPKLDGARRIRYKGDEMYLMPHKQALRMFSDTLISGEEPNDSLVIICGGNGYKYDICATSDGLTEPDFTMKALFSENEGLPYERKICRPYHFPSLFVVMADMVLNKNEITEDDNIKYFKNVENTTKNIFEFIFVSAAINDYLHLLALLSILKKGISEYAEAINDVYYETRRFANWGTGEENSSILSKQFMYNEPQPNMIIIICNRSFIINKAIKSPYWQEIPYIKLIAENRDFPE